MMRTGLVAIGVPALLALSAPALAGRDIGYAATGPVFVLPAGVSVERLDVHVSTYSVRLAYVFMTNTRQTMHFSFAMPDMPVDASPDAIGVAEGDRQAGFTADTQPVNYLDLSVSVNGETPALTGHGRALLDGRDVTRRLRDADVPLLYDLDGETPWPNLQPDAHAKLAADGLLQLDAAQWTYQADFAWDTVLEPGETRVEIGYIPVTRYWTDINLDDFPEIATDGSATQAYCIDDAVRRAFLSGDLYYELYTVTHLGSRGGWHGPVGRYRLEVDKQHATDFIAFCPPNAKKVSPTRFEWIATDYTQDDEIGILFFWDASVADEQE